MHRLLRLSVALTLLLPAAVQGAEAPAHFDPLGKPTSPFTLELQIGRAHV